MEAKSFVMSQSLRGDQVFLGFFLTKEGYRDTTVTSQSLRGDQVFLGFIKALGLTK